MADFDVGAVPDFALIAAPDLAQMCLADARPGFVVAVGVEFVFVEGVQRDQLVVWQRGEPEARTIVLDGDATAWMDPPPEPRRSQVLDWVNRERAQLKAVPADYKELVIRNRLGQGP